MEGFIQGTQFEDLYIETALEIQLCDASSTTCKSDTEMQAKISELKVSFFFMNTNFDGTNITVPLVNYLQFYPDLAL